MGRLVLAALLCFPLLAEGVGTSSGAQASTSTLTGLVVDATGAALPGAEIVLVNAGTALRRQAVSGRNGEFTFVTLPPGRYMLTTTLSGFASSEMSEVILNVDDRAEVRVELQLANRGEAVTVKAEAPRLSTTPAVGTVIDRTFVENLPLNGRSFQALLELTPGVVFTKTTGGSEGGQFSVNGQRTNANYFLVDGVSANTGILAAGANDQAVGQSGSGVLPAMTALGGTNGLVSVDSLQEFRIQTSTYAPEFGRMPGGQVSMVTRSGTNNYHGSVFEYFRDESMDANDWFQNRAGLPKPELRQHDFGGVLGGPIVRNQLFAFASYEGLRLRQPQAKTTQVPSLERRRTALAALQPYLNAFPLPNGRDYGDGFAELTAVYSDPSRIDSSSLRLDHNAGSRVTTFGRISHAPSYSSTRGGGGLPYVSTANQKNTSVTVGTTWILSSRLVHDLRANYTSNDAPGVATLDSFQGAVPPSVDLFAPGLSPANSVLSFTTSTASWNWGRTGGFLQRQINIVDSLTMTSASHELKFGLDYRRAQPRLGGEEVGYEALSVPIGNLQTGQGLYARYVNDPAEHSVAFDTLSLYAQDTWRARPRLTLTYGVRWELVPPPHTTEGEQAVTLENIDDPYSGSMRLAPRGTALWDTRHDNFAPRVGASYVVSERPNAQLIVKGGVGMFYDLGYGQVSNAYRAFPFTATKQVSSASLPPDPALRQAPVLGVDPPTRLWVMDPNIELPVVYQWNVTAEQSLGQRQTITASYVRSSGRDLLKLDRYRTARLADWPRNTVDVNINRNRGYSEYRALQLQFQRRLSAGLQAIASYTLGHAEDTSSSDAVVSIPAERLPPDVDFGDADFDVRHVFSAAVTYNVPGYGQSPVVRRMTEGWGVDVMLRARSGSPYVLATNVPFPPETQTARPNIVAGQPLWIDDPAVPGGRKLNRQAFSIPAAETQGNARRGTVRGFSAKQVDLSLRRDFGLLSRARLQLRVDMFNVLNTPNFADGIGNLGSSLFGVSQQMLNRGLGGLNALYQIGGPRSTQLSAKLLF